MNKITMVLDPKAKNRILSFDPEKMKGEHVNGKARFGAPEREGSSFPLIANGRFGGEVLSDGVDANRTFYFKLPIVICDEPVFQPETAEFDYVIRCQIHFTYDAVIGETTDDYDQKSDAVAKLANWFGLEVKAVIPDGKGSCKIVFFPQAERKMFYVRFADKYSATGEVKEPETVPLPRDEEIDDEDDLR